MPRITERIVGAVVVLKSGEDDTVMLYTDIPKDTEGKAEANLVIKFYDGECAGVEHIKEYFPDIPIKIKKV